MGNSKLSHSSTVSSDIPGGEIGYEGVVPETFLVESGASDSGWELFRLGSSRSCGGRGEKASASCFGRVKDENLELKWALQQSTLALDAVLQAREEGPRNPEGLRGPRPIPRLRT